LLLVFKIELVIFIVLTAVRYLHQDSFTQYFQ